MRILVVTIAAILCGCAGPHRPERDGVYITSVPTVVTCDREGAAILCRTIPASLAHP